MFDAAGDFLQNLQDSVSGISAGDALEAVAAEIRAAQRILITAHTQPDGDALGSGVALDLGLRRLGKDVQVVAGEPGPSKYRTLLPEGVVEVVESVEDVGHFLPVDLCILLDTSEPERSGIFRPTFFAPGQRRVCVDHHLCPAPLPFDAHAVVTEAPATGNLVLALLDRLGVPLSLDIAQALWIAVATDTGWFRFPNANAWAFRDAARLVACGVPLETVYDRIYQDYPPSRAHVLGAVLSALKADLGGRFVWSYLPQEVLRREGTDAGELDGMVDSLKTVGGAEVMALVVELAPSKLKVSLRARGPVDVEPIARSFGGGGHAKAAGCRFSGSIEDLIQQLSGAVGKALR